MQIHYTSESPVRLFYIKKVVKWCKNKIFIKNPDIPKPPDHLRRFIILTIWHISFLLISCTRTSYILFTHYYFTLSWCRKYKSGSKHTSSDLESLFSPMKLSFISVRAPFAWYKWYLQIQTRFEYNKFIGSTVNFEYYGKKQV